MSMSVASDVWADRRRRVAELRSERRFVRQLLDFYGALLPVQEKAFHDAISAAPSPAQVHAFVAETVVPSVVDVSVAFGPDSLRSSAMRWLEMGTPYSAVDRWMGGEDQTMVERFITRASLGPVLEALGPEVRRACAGPRDAHHCPQCGGPPQLSYSVSASDDLATGPRRLLCARCGASWGYPRMTCAACGEDTGPKLPIFSEEGTASGERGSVVRGLPSGRSDRVQNAIFPHLRIEACDSCRRYLLNVDCADDPLAVPVVDELSAVPLDLVARERGYSKIIPNLLGF